MELLVDDESPEAEFVVRGLHCHAALESTGISLTPQKSWKCMLGISVPRHSKQGSTNMLKLKFLAK